ncbi:hypothetical protein ACWF7H_10550 [Peribacillus butanolivorans]
MPFLFLHTEWNVIPALVGIASGLLLSQIGQAAQSEELESATL